MPPAQPPERLLCDTSFVGHVRARRAKPERYRHWDADLLKRIDTSILAISVISLAESRYGYLNAGWGPKRIADEERGLAFPGPVKEKDSAGPIGPTLSAANCAKSAGLGNGRRTGRLISRRRAAGFRLRRERGGRRERAAS